MVVSIALSCLPTSTYFYILLDISRYFLPSSPVLSNTVATSHVATDYLKCSQYHRETEFSISFNFIINLNLNANS